MIYKPYSLLVVDDDEEIAELVVDILKSEISADTLAVTTTSSSVEAEKILKGGQINIVITDMNMPTFNGYDIVKTSLAGNATTMVLVLTGDLSISVILTCFRDGAFLLLSKPVIPEKLIHSVQLCIDRLDDWHSLVSDFQRPG